MVALKTRSISGSTAAGLVACALVGALGCGNTTDSGTTGSTVRTVEATPPPSGSHNCQDHDDDEDSVELRRSARLPVAWHRPGQRPGKPVPVKILGFNDFHGQLSPRPIGARFAGGAAVMASYLRAASAGVEDRTFISHGGDHVGASPPNAALLQDEPAISFLNSLTRHCSYHRVLNFKCNVIGTLGNHEFDDGRAELLRLINGGNHATGPFLETPWKGARFPYIPANVIDASTRQPIVSPYVVRHVDGVPIAFIGAVLKETPTIVTPTGVAGLEFLDEADAINSYVPELQRRGIHAIVIQIHQGTGQASYLGPTDGGVAAPTGALTSIISRLDDDIDVIVAGHTHQFTNALINNANGKPVLVTQAFANSTAFASIDLVLDSKMRDVVSKTASVVTTWTDEGPGLTPDAAMAAMVAAADQRVAPLVNEAIGQAAGDITRAQNAAGESALGDLIAEAQRVSIGAEFAVMNPGGIRAEILSGEVTWGELFTVQPFGNTVVGLTLTGQQIYDLLNQQWGPPQPAGGRVLQIAGFGYTWNSAVPEGGQRVVEVHDANGTPINLSATYRIAANNFIAAGGDNFTVLRSGTNQVGGPIDLDALIAHVKALPQPFSQVIQGRITRQ